MQHYGAYVPLGAGWWGRSLTYYIILVAGTLPSLVSPTARTAFLPILLSLPVPRSVRSQKRKIGDTTGAADVQLMHTHTTQQPVIKSEDGAGQRARVFGTFVQQTRFHFRTLSVRETGNGFRLGSFPAAIAAVSDPNDVQDSDMGYDAGRTPCHPHI